VHIILPRVEKANLTQTEAAYKNKL
jgi:hypothetical protein